jgi:hypothetical protein
VAEIGDLASSGVRRVNAQVFDVKSHEDAKCRENLGPGPTRQCRENGRQISEGHVVRD